MVCADTPGNLAVRFVFGRDRVGGLVWLVPVCLAPLVGHGNLLQRCVDSRGFRDRRKPHCAGANHGQDDNWRSHRCPWRLCRSFAEKFGGANQARSLGRVSFRISRVFMSLADLAASRLFWTEGYGPRSLPLKRTFPPPASGPDSGSKATSCGKTWPCVSLKG